VHNNNQPNTKSTPNPNHTTEQLTIVSIQLDIVTRPTYPEKLTQDNVVAPFVQLSVVIVPQPNTTSRRKKNKKNTEVKLTAPSRRWTGRPN